MPDPDDGTRPHPASGAAVSYAPYASCTPYDSWRTSHPTHWEVRGLHWHAYSWRGDGKRLGDAAARRSAAEDIVPFASRDWLLKDARLIRASPGTPEEALTWLREHFDAIAPTMRPARQRTFLRDEVRFGTALYTLRCGTDLSWGFWLANGSYQALSLIAVDSRQCPLHPPAPRRTGNATSHTGSSAPAASQSVKQVFHGLL
ncbi:hypothetical protein IAG44_23615 [Streptomyces roseirectus]|uniref:Uncharacterized protein n=1 Tax=Streptomyces roseirectus TaxID=2768066 RepID=A0A7H0IH42_9ACTN|nr:hypothetical protein [Streptomyces roseirectus]QNP72108.1 hypothetical protein IAG44_23615 [Streptomyces roseirectus]